MADLDEIIRLESELRPLLKKNQQKLKLSKERDQLIELMKQYLNSVDSYEERDIFFLKRFSKTARTVVKMTDKLDDSLDMLYVLNRSGSAMTSQFEEITENNRKQLAAHFLADAGDIAYKKFRISGDLEFGLSWYNDMHQAANLVFDVSLTESAAFYSLSGHAARAMLGKTNDLVWGEKAYSDYMRSGSITESERQKFANHVYSLASKVAEKMITYVKTPEEKYCWVDKMYTASLKEVKTSQEDQKILSYSHLGNSAAMLFDYTGEIKYAKEAIESYNKVIDSYPENPSKKQKKIVRNMRDHVNKIEEKVTDMLKQ